VKAGSSKDALKHLRHLLEREIEAQVCGFYSCCFRVEVLFAFTLAAAAGADVRQDPQAKLLQTSHAAIAASVQFVSFQS
jgi:hypothetical protein